MVKNSTLVALPIKDEDPTNENNKSPMHQGQTSQINILVDQNDAEVAAMTYRKAKLQIGVSDANLSV